MRKSTTKSADISVKRERQALTPEAQEARLIGLAMDRAEELLLSGNAPSQIITHYLKLGSMRERKENERLTKEIELMQAKIDALESSQRMEELYSKAIEAMQIYKGQTNDELD